MKRIRITAVGAALNGFDWSCSSEFAQLVKAQDKMNVFAAPGVFTFFIPVNKGIEVLVFTMKMKKKKKKMYNAKVNVMITDDLSMNSEYFPDENRQTSD